jgi:hypothetical protein
MFDPYQTWLGIPREQQPPSYYRLLGISHQERDRKIIEEAIIQQTARVRIYQAGQFARECANLLNQIAEAGTVLLDPVKRKKYDDYLVQQAQPKATPPAAADSALPPLITSPYLSRTRQPSPLSAVMSRVLSGGLSWRNVLVLGAAFGFFLSGLLVFVIALILRKR